MPPLLPNPSNTSTSPPDTRPLSPPHPQHYLHIFEYQYVVHAIPPPFNVPLLLWDTCYKMCSSKESRRNLARMNLDDGYDNDPVYGAPHGMERHEGIPLMRKYVCRLAPPLTSPLRTTSLLFSPLSLSPLSHLSSHPLSTLSPLLSPPLLSPLSHAPFP